MQGRALGLLLLACTLGPFPWTLCPAADKVSDAIDAGIEYLLPETETHVKTLEGKYGSANPEPKQEDRELGKLGLKVYALIVAGVAADNPVIKRCFDLLGRMEFSHIYTTACYVFALDAAIAQVEGDLAMFQLQKAQARFRDEPSIGKEHRPRLHAAVESFLKAQNQKGVWRYHPNPKSDEFDNSNVQFAVLALGVGAKRRVPMEPDVWLRIVDHFVKGQQKKGDPTPERLTLRPRDERGKPRDELKLIPKDSGGASRKDTSGKQEAEKRGGTQVARGTTSSPENPEVGLSIEVLRRGWDYENKGGATWNMTAAGLSSLLLARENLRGRIAGEAKAALDRAIRDGYGWLMGHWNPNEQYYGMYSLEKVGDLGDVELFGKHDWHAELTAELVKRQEANGSWRKGDGHDEDPPIATAFALLILNRATSLLTQTQTSKVVVSGKRAAQDPQDRSWVYVPEIDTSIHYPSLLRAVRERPSPKLFRFVESIIDHYAGERKGELVPELAYARSALKNKAAQKAIEDALVKVTGARYKDPENYLKWHRRWERIIKIGETKKTEHTALLLKYYETTTQSVPLKKTIMWSLSQLGAREVLPLLLADLSHPDPELRHAAYSYFKGYFIDFPPPFDAHAGDGIREKQVAAIKDWYAGQGK